MLFDFPRFVKGTKTKKWIRNKERNKEREKTNMENRKH